MYWPIILFFVGIAIAVSGLFGALPGIVIGLVLAVGAILWFALVGRDAKDAPQIVEGPLEPTGDARQPAPRSGSGSAETANERVGQA